MIKPKISTTPQEINVNDQFKVVPLKDLQVNFTYQRQPQEVDIAYFAEHYDEATVTP